MTTEPSSLPAPVACVTRLSCVSSRDLTLTGRQPRPEQKGNSRGYREMICICSCREFATAAQRNVHRHDLPCLPLPAYCYPPYLGRQLGTCSADACRPASCSTSIFFLPHFPVAPWLVVGLPSLVVCLGGSLSETTGRLGACRSFLSSSHPPPATDKYLHTYVTPLHWGLACVWMDTPPRLSGLSWRFVDA